jgi:hypothetical protein
MIQKLESIPGFRTLQYQDTSACRVDPTNDSHFLVTAMSRPPIFRAAAAFVSVTMLAIGPSQAGPSLGPPIDAAGRELAKEMLRRGGGPGGGDVAGLEAVQVAYGDPANGNMVLLAWTENTPNEFVDIIVDGTTLGQIPGLAEADLPGFNGVNITHLDPGTHTFGASGGGTQMEAVQLVLDACPCADVGDLACASAGRSGSGKCILQATWTNPGPLPDVYFVYVNDVGFSIPGDLTSVTREVDEGDSVIQVRGYSENANGKYLSPTLVTTSCSVSCADLPCDPPYDLLLCQCVYSSEAGNAILASWSNGESPYATSLIGLIDGDQVGTISGDSIEAVFNGLDPGDHVIGVQGDCGVDGLSGIIDASFTTLAETPFTSPIAGDLQCEFDPTTSEAHVSWTNDAPSLFIEVFVQSGAEIFDLGTIVGDSTTVTVTNAVASDVVVLQFFGRVGGACHGSTLRSCPTSQERFKRADVDGSGIIDLTDPITTLTFLFLGGSAPTCPDAADTDDSGKIDITDAILTLTWQFLGGVPPAQPLDCGADVEPDDLAACASQC